MENKQISEKEYTKIVGNLKAENDFLKYENAALKKALFGQKSEKRSLTNNQISLNFNEDIPKQSDVPKIQQKVKSKGKPKRKPLNPDLERVPLEIFPEVDYSKMTFMKSVVTESIIVTHLKYKVLKIIRHQYVDENGSIHIGDMPPTPFPKSIASPSLAQDIVVDKYLHHTPLYRKAKKMKNQGVKMSPSTMGGIVKATANLLKPIYDCINNKIINSDYIQADESSIRVLNKDNENGSVKGCMLVKVAPNEKLMCMQYLKTKQKSELINALSNFSGYLQVDGNPSYLEMDKKKDITLLNCMVHSRRYFIDALQYDKDKAGFVLDLIGQVYNIENQIKEKPPDQIKQARQSKALPILNKLKEWLEENLNLDGPKDPLQKAIRYMLKRWKPLTVFLNNGALRIDNNIVENKIRPLALGRKNYLFAGSHKGADHAALFYSLFATCEMNGINPGKWMQDVLHRISEHSIKDIHQLLPTKNYKFLTVK